ncbi:Glutamyl-tRNA reductase 1, chloroplastic [Hordeum vulgare]|nr:Glutamyl-tRNA reductase 1, chloroplastic [Hordeum vulgare]
MAAAPINPRSADSWRRLWKLRGPRNIQMFAWRLKHESLALRVHLKKRGIPVEDTKCLFCGKADEDGGHLFIKCKNAKAVWRELALEPERRELQEIPSVHHALDYIWSLRGLGWGVIARDAEGAVIAARAGRKDHVYDAFAAEVYALAHAISCAAELGLVRVLFETDSTLLQEAMDFARVDASAYAAVIEDLKFQLKMWFSRHKITVCRREANTAAHHLASIAKSGMHLVQPDQEEVTHVDELLVQVD